MKRKYWVKLREEEREQLRTLINSGTAPARKIRRAHILLKTDQSEDGAGWTYQQIVKAFDVSEETISAIRKSYVEEGLEATLNRKQSEREYLRRLDGKQEAQLAQIACSPPPTGRSHWSVRALAERMEELGYVETISHETVRLVLKKMISNPG